MKSVLLSAGFGTRLGELTTTIPKVMLPVRGKPSLEHNIENLRRHGVTTFLINTHYMPEKIQDHFKDGSSLGVNIRYSYEKSMLGTAGALQNFKHELNETFIVGYGDVISDIDVGALYEVHRRKNSQATIVLDSVRDQEGKGVVLTDKERVTQFIEKPESRINGGLINSGFYMFEPSVFTYIPDGVSDFGKDIFPRMIASPGLYAHVHRGYIFDIGTVQDLREAEHYLRRL